jgi:hypothetical protein
VSGVSSVVLVSPTISEIFYENLEENLEIEEGEMAQHKNSHRDRNVYATGNEIRTFGTTFILPECLITRNQIFKI